MFCLLPKGPGRDRGTREVGVWESKKEALHKGTIDFGKDAITSRSERGPVRCSRPFLAVCVWRLDPTAPKHVQPTLTLSFCG